MKWAAVGQVSLVFDLEVTDMIQAASSVDSYKREMELLHQMQQLCLLFYEFQQSADARFWLVKQNKLQRNSNHLDISYL